MAEFCNLLYIWYGKPCQIFSLPSPKINSLFIIISFLDAILISIWFSVLVENIHANECFMFYDCFRVNITDNFFVRLSSHTLNTTQILSSISIFTNSCDLKLLVIYSIQLLKYLVNICYKSI